MGRFPCCEKEGLKKGPWTPEEDQKLLTYIEEYGHGSWRALPAKAGLQRCGKSCRLRWNNYLRPDIKRGKFSLQEEQTIIQLHALLGNRWSTIATHLPKRTDNEIKNYWNTHLKKRLTKMGIDPVTHKPKHHEGLGSGSAQAKDVANISHMAQWESARLEAEARMVKESKLHEAMTANPLQHQNQHHSLVINGFSNTLPQAVNVSKAPPAALPCLDVLKAWQGAWSTTNPSTIRHINNNKLVSGNSMMAVDDLESPTSTLNFPHINAVFNPITQSTLIDSVVPCESGVILQDNNNLTYGRTDASATTAGAAAWFIDSFRSAGNHGDEDNMIMPAAVSNIITEGFTDILVYNSYEDHQNLSSLVEDISGDGGGGGGGGGCCSGGNFEENRSYWNSILNLLNASPSGSPVL